ncbi:DUF2309 domain-containing protein [Hymenobacter lutimineralis]|uniref:Probable inorganic carbon transporter subunit DabA n=1 Tax=Hymenobacter lutimineralis TaxID=2606448 RepID=A0A5D6V9V5_9BACT|nr:DUF2309 domain-containing protein [Hymenobacter lutimineralis]TYZ11952.1 DUF2309 domain-containing protein [Hymenobacter lutimineralis]
METAVKSVKTKSFRKHILQAEQGDSTRLAEQVARSFNTIAPFWPLKNLIAVNPLQGLEDLPVEEALPLGSAYFQQAALPVPMEAVNRQTIKWLQVYFDDGQATLPMPLRYEGLYAAWRQLAVHDACLHNHDEQKKAWLTSLPENPHQAIQNCLLQLGIARTEHQAFLTLLLTTLPGWASYIRYRTNWAGLDAQHPHPVTQTDYLAVRLIITWLLWPEAGALVAWHQQVLERVQSKPAVLEQIQQAERTYRLPLLAQLAAQSLHPPRVPKAQLVFCIDVRSEAFRRALEATGDYQTLGFAGFFGVPVQITDTVTGESYASCPVLLSPQHIVKEAPGCGQAEQEQDRRGYVRLTKLNQLYQSLKYTFTTPFALVESLGIATGTWMGLRSLAPGMASKLKSSAVQAIRKPIARESSLDTLSLADQCVYAEGALRLMGLTHHFAPLVVFCGHGSTTQNNAYATALDCGACGGRHGAPNAGILAGILNTPAVRTHLRQTGISIPDTTRFIAAEHNTTTDEVSLYGHTPSEALDTLTQDLAKARQANSLERLGQMQQTARPGEETQQTWLRSQDWAQVRPEWGLARNAAFIVGPRDLTASLNLEGRSFLHSYDYTQDPTGSALTTILTAPMVVAEWINTQYLFSTLDNVAFGGGSKITQNITGKIGIMQGNASDLMTGLPLQSVYATDRLAYHQAQRLMTVVYAPRPVLDAIISTQPVLQKLFGNGWVQLACLDPETHQPYLLTRDLAWQTAQ